jgi:hypothetical protein
MLAGAALWLAGCGGGDDNAGLPTDNSGIMPGQAQGKFCHELVRNDAKIELALEIGTPTLVRIAALSETCSPSLGSPCTPLPVGYFPARLMEGSKVLSSGALRIGLGGKYIFWARITDHPTITPLPIDPTVACETTAIDFSDGGVDAGDAGRDAADAGATDGADAGATDGADAGAVGADPPVQEAGSPDVAQQLGDAGDDAPADAAAELDAAAPDAPAVD